MIKKLHYKDALRYPYIADIVAERVRDRRDIYKLIAVAKNDYDMAYFLKYELCHMEAIPDFDW